MQRVLASSHHREDIDAVQLPRGYIISGADGTGIPAPAAIRVRATAAPPRGSISAEFAVQTAGSFSEGRGARVPPPTVELQAQRGYFGKAQFIDPK